MPTGTDWSRYQRGPRNRGQLDGKTALPKSATPYWQFYTRANAPVVVDGTLYTTETTTDRLAVARDAATGRVEWTTPTQGGEPGPPTVADGAVYVLTWRACTAFDRTTGRVRWRRELGSGRPGAPLVRNGTVYIASGRGLVYALSAADGATHWRTRVSGPRAGSLAADADGLYVGTAEGLLSLSFDGQERWRAPATGPMKTTPAVGDGTVYAHDERGRLTAVATDDGTARWTASLAEPERSAGLALGAGTVYTGSADGLHAVRRSDGEGRWHVSTPEPAFTPTTDGEAVYFGTTGFEDRTVRAVAVADGTVRWRHRTDRKHITDYIIAGVYSPPTLVDGGVYVVAADGLYAFGQPE